jgi:peptidoglycan hydrolase FlgJ
MNMDLNIPGTDAWGLALGKPKSNMLMSQLRPEKQALDVVNAKAGRLTSKSSAAPEDEQIREAAQEFESVFLFQMLKQVRNSIHKEEEGIMNGGMGEEMFTGLLDEEYAKVMANSNSTGLADVIYQQMSRKAGIKPDGLMPVETTQSATVVQGAMEDKMRTLVSEIESANRAAVASTAGGNL